MTARPEERSEFDPVAEHGSSPKKPLLRSDKRAGERAGERVGKHDGEPTGKQPGGLLDKLGKHVGIGAGSHPGRSVNRRTDKGMDKRPDERTLREGRRERRTRETGPAPRRDPRTAAQPGPSTGTGRQTGRGAERMAPEQPPADPRDTRRAPGARPGSQPVDAGHALAERMADTTRDGTLPPQRTSAHSGHAHPPQPGQGRGTALRDRHGGGDRAAAADDRRGVPVLAERAGAAEKRLHEAVIAFVDDPRRSVEEADALLEEITTVFTDALAERRRVLRDSWHGGSAVTDTEELRESLRNYRDLVARLLHV